MTVSDGQHLPWKMTMPPERTRAYEARFCLGQQRDGSALVHQVRHGERPGKRLFGCLPPGE